MIQVDTTLSRNDILDRSRLDAVESLLLINQYRDQKSQKHNQRVGYVSALIAQKLGLTSRDIELIRHAAPLHDIGTLFIPEKLLFKPEKLSAEEFEVIKTHVDAGANLLWNSQSDIISMAHTIVKMHHERYDGSGYPNGLKDKDIPIVGHIVAVADVFDSLTHEQPYRQAWPMEKAIAEIKKQAGKQFNPKVVEAFLAVVKEQKWLSPKTESKRHILMKGRLGALNLFDIINSLVRNGQSCKLYIYTEFSHSLILFYDGRLIHAEVDGIVGEKAILQIALKTQEMPNAPFVVEAWNVEFAPRQLMTIETPTEQLLLNAVIEMDHQELIAV